MLGVQEKTLVQKAAEQGYLLEVSEPGNADSGFTAMDKIEGWAPGEARAASGTWLSDSDWFQSKVPFPAAFPEACRSFRVPTLVGLAQLCVFAISRCRANAIDLFPFHWQTKEEQREIFSRQSDASRADRYNADGETIQNYANAIKRSPPLLGVACTVHRDASAPPPPA